MEKTLKILYQLIEFNFFIIIGLQVMLPEETISSQGVEEETLH